MPRRYRVACKACGALWPDTGVAKACADTGCTKGDRAERIRRDALASEAATQAPQGFTYPTLSTISGDSGLIPLTPPSTPPRRPGNMPTKTTTKTPKPDTLRPFTVDVTIMARDLDAAVDATHDVVLDALRRADVPFIHEATRAAKPSEAATQEAADLAATPEEPDSFEAVARDLWSGMAMGMSLSHYDSSKVHARLHKLARAEKETGKRSQPAKQGGAAKLALATLGVRAIEYVEANEAYRASKAEREAAAGYSAGASDETLRAAVKADEVLGEAARQYAATVAAEAASFQGA